MWECIYNTWRSLSLSPACLISYLHAILPASISQRIVYFTNWPCDCFMLIIHRTDIFIYIYEKRNAWSSLLPACSNNKLMKGKRSRQIATSLQWRVNRRTSSFSIFNWMKNAKKRNILTNRKGFYSLIDNRRISFTPTRA